MALKANPVPVVSRGSGEPAARGARRLAGFLLALTLGFGTALAQETQLTEAKLKAAFLFNFAKFVEWPPAAFAGTNTPITIGILGESSFSGDLEATVRGKTINYRAIVVKTIPSTAEATNCQVLFMAITDKIKIQQIISSLGAASVLTVGDADHFTEAGGMINFLKEGNKVRFEINEAAAKRAGLKISSKLLNLAVSSRK